MFGRDVRGSDSDEPDEPAPEAAAAGRSRTVRRQRAFLVVAVAAAVVSTGGLAASSLIKSPAERAADSAPPPSTLLTATATMQVLNPSVVVRGTLYPPTQYNVTPTAGSSDVTQLYVSRMSVKVGDDIGNGQQLAEVSGHPLFVLAGAVPAYRDLKPGNVGPDVAQLQDSLEELGHSTGSDARGTYGPGTERAVTGFYEQLGYPVPTTGAATQQAVDAASKAVDADQAALNALLAQRSAGQDVDQQITAARKQLTADRTALARAEEVNGPMMPAAHVVFLPALPASVTAVNADVGMPVAGPLLSLTSGGLSLTGQLTPAQALSVKPGMAVEILAESTGARLTGTVGQLGTQTTALPAGRIIPIGGGGGGAAAPGAPAAAPGAAANAAGVGAAPGVPAYVPMTITPSAPFPAMLNGQNVRITVLRSSSTAPVLTVPVSAIFTTGDGRTAVTRVSATGRRSTVPVTTGVTANGFVGVTPPAGAELAQGDQVAVGK